MLLAEPGVFEKAGMGPLWRPEVYCGRRVATGHASGDVAQLGERCVRIAEARGSSPLISTIHLPLQSWVHRRRLDVEYPQ